MQSPSPTSVDRQDSLQRQWRLLRIAVVKWLGTQSAIGLLAGLLFFSLSLTPSLIPRHFVLQGILSGCVFAAGYGLGVFFEWLWSYLGLPLPRKRLGLRVLRALLAASVLLAVTFLWFSTGWQNSIRTVMSMAPVESHQPVWVAAIALVPAAILIGIGTLIVHGVRTVARWLARIIPRRAALVGGMLIVAMLTTLLVNGIFVRWVFNTADRFYAELDQLAGSYEAAPTDPLRSGSDASLIAWDTIGLDARIYVQSSPTREEIEAVIERPSQTPLRVYVGLRSAPTTEERAQLALDEMLRVGAFDRSVLVLIMPVGTGWVDPPAIDTLEFLHAGDVASVALQYSYLTSWLSLLAEPDVGVEAARALFYTVYDHWRSLPPESRPKLYLHGLSLGAYSSQTSAMFYDIMGEPFHGALWVGPPFASSTWRNLTANREAGSPSWHPRVGDGAAIRFANQGQALDQPDAPWGAMRIMFLQYPSDPIVFFEPSMIYRRPAWLNGERPPDISPQLDWYPVVTFFQLLMDMALAQTSPIGFGHVYAPTDYLDAWVSLTDPPGWTEDQLAGLRQEFTRHGSLTTIFAGWFRR